MKGTAIKKNPKQGTRSGLVAGVEIKGRVVIGSREEAEFQARKMIDRWLKKRSTQKH